MKPDTDKNIPLAPGSVFEKYTILKQLGSGGMGAVYLVKHNLLDTLFALKVLHPDIAEQNASCVRRFIREAKLACKIKHPNLIEVHDAGQNAETGIYYIVMDYVSGGSVRSRLNKIKYFSLAESLKIIEGVACALNAAQTLNLVHRDIKPENIMFAGDDSIKLADLGIAKFSSSGETSLTMTSSVFGTPSYMSPEQAKDSSKVDCRADIFSLGIVFYEMLSGELPFTGNTTMEILAQLVSDTPVPDIRSSCKDIPDDAAGLIADMTCKDIEKRIQTPAELLTRLKAVSDHLDQISAANSRSWPESGQKTALAKNDRTQKIHTPASSSGNPAQAGREATVPVSPASPPSVRDGRTDSGAAAKTKQMRHAGPWQPRKILIAALGSSVFLLILMITLFFFLRSPNRENNVRQNSPSKSAAVPLPRKPAAAASVTGKTDQAATFRPAQPAARLFIPRPAGQPDRSPDPDEKQQELIPPAHSVIVLGPLDSISQKLAGQLKKETKKTVMRIEFESVSGLRNQIQTLLNSRPDIMVLVPVHHFAESGISLASFEMLFTESVDRIRDRKIPMRIVCCKPVVGQREKAFFDTVKQICDRRSLTFRQIAKPSAP